MLDDRLLAAFMHGFYGYGNYHAPYWFVGMEEGGGNSLEEVQRRLSVWNERGRQELEDVYEYHAGIGISKHWAEPAVLEATWNKLIRVIFGIHNTQPTVTQVREYQKFQLGRRSGETCLLELLPLPSPSTRTWLYADITSLPYLTTREEYTAKMLPARARHIRSMIAEFRPKAVLFYGLKYLKHWMAVADLALERHRSDGYYMGRKSGTVYLASRHPTAFGVTNAYFHAIGRFIAENL